MKDTELERGIAAFDALSGGTTTIVTQDTIEFGAPPDGLQLSDVLKLTAAGWSEKAGRQILVTPIGGHSYVGRRLISFFSEAYEEKRGHLVQLLASLAHNEELKDTGRIFQTVIDTIPVRVFWKDRDCVYQGCNRLFAGDAGFNAPEDMVQKTDFDMGWPEQADLYRADDQEVMETGEAKIDYEEPQTHPGGIRAWLQTSKIPLRNTAGEVFGVLGTYADITPRKTAEAEREALLQDVETKNAELERFTYTVSHDLKSPLVTINGFLGVLEEDISDLQGQEELATSLRDSVQRIRRAGGKMTLLLDELLEMSRIGRVLRPQEPTEIRPLIDDAVLLCDGSLKEAKAEISIDGEFPEVFVDGPRIVQVLQNLIDNACKYRSPDRDLKIAVQCRGDGTLSVSDNGIGIEPRHEERIFRVFEKLDPTTPGSGIGLALVKRIIETHRGSVRVVHSPPGTQFRLKLPLTEKG